jgi:hypothetical protein
MVPFTITIPFEGSWALALLGSLTRVPEAILSVAAGVKRVAWKVMVGMIL